MAGTITQPKIVRYSANERADTIDVNAMGAVLRNNIDALMRTLMITPRNTAATATGTIVTGLSLTLNPTAPGDGIVRINNELGVAIDADGRYIIKDEGEHIDVSIPAGGASYQIYLYGVEEPADTATRRFLPVSSPFNEYSRAIETMYVAGYGVHTRVGGLGTAVAEDTVDGRTRALVLIGVASNLAGVITVTGYNAGTAPNGTSVTNRLSTVTLPAAFPTTPYKNADWRTGDAKLNAALYEVGLLKWQGSTQLTPGSANNFGAFDHVVGGVDSAFRGRTVVTIGKDSASIYGDIDVDDYASFDLAFAAAYALLPADGGTILLKMQGTVTMAGNVVLTAQKNLKVVGQSDKFSDGSLLLIDMVTYKFVCPAAVSASTLVFEGVQLASSDVAATGTFVELHDFWSLVVRRSTWFYLSAYAGGSPTRMIMWNAATASPGSVYITDSYLSWANNSIATGGGIVGTTLAFTGTFYTARTSYSILTANVGTLSHRMISLTDLRDDFVVEDCRFFATGMISGPFPNQGFDCIVIETTDNTALQKNRRIIRGNSFLGRTNLGLNRALNAINFGKVANLRILNNDLVDCTFGIIGTTNANVELDLQMHGNVIDGCTAYCFRMNVDAGFTATNMRFTNNRFTNGVDSGKLGIGFAGDGFADRVVIDSNDFDDATVSGGSIQDAVIINNTFVGAGGSGYYQSITIGGVGVTAIVINLRIQSNVFRKCQIPTLNFVTLTGAAITILANTLRGLKILDNTFEDCENTVYTAGGTMDHSIIRVLAASQYGTQIDRNSFYDIGTGLTGVGKTAPVLIAVGGSTWGAAAAGSIDGLSVCNNMCGDTGSACEPIVIYWIALANNITIADNVFEFDANTHTHTYGSMVIGQTGNTFRNVSIVNNSMRMCDGTGAGTIGANAMWLGGTFYNMTIQGNRWSSNVVGGWSAGLGLGWGNATIHYLTFDNNGAFIEGDTATTNAKFNVVDPVSASSKPAFPAGLAYYGGNNFNIYNP